MAWNLQENWIIWWSLLTLKSVTLEKAFFTEDIDIAISYVAWSMRFLSNFKLNFYFWAHSISVNIITLFSRKSAILQLFKAFSTLKKLQGYK